MQIKKMFLLVLGLLLVSLPVMAEDGLVATVGEKEITETELNQVANSQQIVSQVAQANQDFAQFLSSSEMGQELLNEYKEEKLDDLIDEKVLKIETEKRDITLTQEEEENFDNYIKQIKEENDLNDEELLAALKQQGFGTLDEYKEKFLGNLRINKLMEEEINSKISVSDEEAKEEYNKKKYDDDFEEIKEDIKNSLKMQKQQMALSEFINNAKETIKIEKY
ncbi:MAG: SurA N-terminal domain-containing protein [Halanaerobiales bacterium]